MSAQSLEALEIANEKRFAMAEYKVRLNTYGQRFASAALLRPPEALRRMKVGVFLKSLRGFGPDRMERTLREAGIPRAAIDWRVGPFYEEWHRAQDRTLTARQRAVLAVALTSRHRR